MFPAFHASRCVTIHFLRHAEAESNVAAHVFPKGDSRRSEVYCDAQYFDARLSQRGHEQCTSLRSRIEGQLGSVEVVFVSPLTRTLQTATEVLQGLPAVCNASWVATEEVREFGRSGQFHPCDSRRASAELESEFPHVSFAEVPAHEVLLGANLPPESEAQVALRARKFLLHLQEEKIRSCVVVSHSGFLRHLFLKHLRYEAEDVDFENAELRSVVLVFPSATNDLRPALG
mmetsp:Transcript_59673/g.159688  ORF Transcript_59673/g.159688 Transcript_59673/m.159688 type:complete len:231 (+) Transcript_59673:20-712(+)